MALCSYKDMFGKPGEGVHKYRVFNIAIVDLGLTILAGFILARVFKWNAIVTILAMLLVGVVAHRLFCVRTTVDKLLFPC